MKARKTSRKRQTNLIKSTAAQEETRASLTITVAWMLGALATIAAEVVGVLVNTIVVVTQSAPTWLQAISEILFFVASITGLMTLLITPVCLKARHVASPKPITLLVIVIATTPLVILVIRALRV